MLDCTSDEIYNNIYLRYKPQIDNSNDWEFIGIKGAISSGRDLKEGINQQLKLYQKEAIEDLNQFGFKDYKYSISLDFIEKKKVDKEELNEYLDEYLEQYDNDIDAGLKKPITEYYDFIVHDYIQGEKSYYIDSFEVLKNHYDNDSELGFMYYLERYSSFYVVEYNAKTEWSYNYNGTEKSYENTGKVFDICYQEDGEWYSSYFIRVSGCGYNTSIDKEKKSEDIAGAETINTAVSAALANEDAYDEVADKMIDGENGYYILATAESNKIFISKDSSYDVFLTELNNNLGGKAPEIKYTKEGAVCWSIAIQSNGKPVVFLGTNENLERWKLQPEIDDNYKN